MVIAELINLLVGLVVYIIVGGICAFVGWQGCEKAHEETFEWCTDCKEYDQKNHCCHRWSKVIRDTVKEMNIVQCRDCIHWGTSNCPLILNTINEGCYCYFGERKEK